MDETLAKLIAANRELVHRDQVYSSFFETIPDLLVIAENGRFIALSQSWEDVTGWTREELMSHPFLYFVVQEDVPETIGEDLKLYGDERGTIDFENRYRTKDGGTVKLQWRSQTVGGKVFAVARVIG